MNTDQKPTDKTAGELKPGDWANDLASLEGRPCVAPGEVLYAHPYADPYGAAKVLIVAAANGAAPDTVRLFADERVQLLTDAELAEMRERDERATRIAEIRQLADWLEEHPEVPTPYGLNAYEHLSYPHDGSVADNVALVRRVAAELGVKVDDRLADRTGVRVTFGRANYELPAWHREGRPGGEPTDPTGLTYQREADDPTPVSPARGVLHAAGAVSGITDGGSRVGEPALITQETAPAEHFEATAWKGPGPGDCGAECVCGVSFDGCDSLAEASQLLKQHIDGANGNGDAMVEADPGACMCWAASPNGCPQHYIREAEQPSGPVDRSTCVAPGDQEHDHAMCEDVVAADQAPFTAEAEPANQQCFAPVFPMEQPDPAAIAEVSEQLARCDARLREAEEQVPFTVAAMTSSCHLSGRNCSWHQAAHVPLGPAECGCAAYRFREDRGQLGELVDHRPECPEHVYTAAAAGWLVQQ